MIASARLEEGDTLELTKNFSYLVTSIIDEAESFVVIVYQIDSCVYPAGAASLAVLRAALPPRRPAAPPLHRTATTITLIL